MAILSSTGLYGFLSSCRKEGKNYISTFREKVCGWKLWEYTVGKFRFEVDEVKVRDRLQSSDHDPLVSDLSRKGFMIETNYEGISGYSRAEFDEIYVRKRAVFKEVVIEQLNTIAGGLVISAAHGKIAAAENALYEGSSSCFVVLDEESSGSSDFIRGDMALCERASYDERAGSFEKKRYWMLVEKSGKTSDEDCPLSSSMKALGKRYLLLSWERCEEKGGTPSEGDVIVQFGYISEYGSISSENGAAIRDRQRAVLISQLGSSRAAFAEYQGIGGREPYFELDDTLHEVTRICGEGSNKFTGNFQVVSESGNTDIKSYVNAESKHLNDALRSDIDDTFSTLTGELSAEFDNVYETLSTKSELQVLSNEISASVAETIEYTDGRIEKVNASLDILPNRISASVKGDYKAAGLEIKVEGEGELQTSSIELNADQIAIKNGSSVAAFFEGGKLNAGLIDVDRLLANQQIMVGDLAMDRNEDTCPALDKITKEYTCIKPITYYPDEKFYRHEPLVLDFFELAGSDKKPFYAECTLDSLVDAYQDRMVDVIFGFGTYGETEGDLATLYGPSCDIKVELVYKLDGIFHVISSAVYERLQINRLNMNAENYTVSSVGMSDSQGKNHAYAKLPKGAHVSYIVTIDPYYYVSKDLSEKRRLHYQFIELGLVLYKASNNPVKRTPILADGALTKFFRDGFFCYDSPFNYIYYRLGDRYEVRVAEEETLVTEGYNKPKITAKNMSGQAIRLDGNSRVPIILVKTGNVYEYYKMMVEENPLPDYVGNSYEISAMYS